MSDHVLCRSRNKNLRTGCKELLNACPEIGNNAGTGASGLEHPRRWRKSYPCHRIPIHVQDHARGAIHRIVSIRWNVADPMYITGQLFVAPSLSSQQERHFWSKRCGSEEE